jgi:hypothetical protein
MSKLVKPLLVAGVATVALWFSPIHAALASGGTDTTILGTQLSGKNEVPAGDPNGHTGRRPHPHGARGSERWHRGELLAAGRW